MRFTGKIELEASTEDEWREMQKLVHLLLAKVRTAKHPELVRIRIDNSDWQATAAVTAVQWPVYRTGRDSAKITVEFYGLDLSRKPE